MQTIPAKTILQKNKTTAWFGNNYNMNLYKGCCHGCIYCDSRSNCYGIEKFDTVRAKKNCMEILRNELRKKVKTGIIGTGAMSDPYNPFEKTEKLTEKSLMLIDAYNFGVTVITKSNLITRDIDLYKNISEHSPVLCKMTVTTCNDQLSKIIEPNVCTSSERFDALCKMSEAGLKTGITLMPVLPFLEDNEQNIIGIVDNAHLCGVKYIYAQFGVTLRQNQRDYFYQKLDSHFPELSLRYRQYYGERYNCVSPNVKKLWKIFTQRCEHYGILYRMNEIIADYQKGYGSMQLSFF